jgi:hypothetical protein
MPDIKVSVFGSAIRTYYWQNLYTQLSSSSVEFEIVYAGQVRPDFDLPPNFKFIYTKIKPAQAWYLAALNCVGETIANIPDDVVCSPDLLGSMYNLYRGQSDEKCIIAPRYFDDGSGAYSNNRFLYDGEDATHFWGRWRLDTHTDAKVPLCPLWSRNFFHNVRPDKRFVALFQDADMARRAIDIGAHIVYLPINGAGVTERHDIRKEVRLVHRFQQDYDLRDWLWGVDGLSPRKDVVQEYVIDGTFTTVSQGNREGWDLA